MHKRTNRFISRVFILGIQVIALAMISCESGSACVVPPCLTSTPTLTAIQPVLVQNKRNSDSVKSNIIQFDNNVTKGDVILVAGTQFEKGVTSVQDNQHDPFIQIGNVIANPQNSPLPQDYIELFYAKNVTGGATQITVNYSALADPHGQDTNVGIYEFAGLSTIAPLDDADVNTSNNLLTETLSMRQLHTSEPKEVCFAVGLDSGPQNDTNPPSAVTVGNGYVFPPNADGQTDAQTDPAGGERYYTEYATVAAGGCKPSFSILYPSFWAMIGITLKA